MSSALISLKAYGLAAWTSASRGAVASLFAVLAIHFGAIVLLAGTERELLPKLIFILTWGALNFAGVALTRRPVFAGALSLSLFALIMVLSRLKYEVLWMTVNFLDVMIVDTDTASFLLAIFPALAWIVPLGLGGGGLALFAIWKMDAFRCRRRMAALGALSCFALLSVLSLTFPLAGWEAFQSGGHISKFARSGVEEVAELMNHGFLDAGPLLPDRLRNPPELTCRPTHKAPHIILVHDESSYDIRMAPGVLTPPGYGEHFQSFDGKERKFIVESNGGSSWFAEYNVLAGLSARSFGRFSYFLTRIAAGRVERGLPATLAQCGYRTFSFYPAYGAFMSARGFQTSVGIQHFFDARDMGASQIEPDSFYYGAAMKMFATERKKGPVFAYVYLAANHFPFNNRWRPDLFRQWHDLGNKPEVDEYLRRQAMSARDYADFLAQLKANYPSEQFLIVRYGDHQPDFASYLLDPSLDEDGIGRRMASYDPRDFTTYYAVDAVNYRPQNTSTALDTLDSAYLPLVVLDAAGIPLDASFREQKRIFQRCHGVFYACQGGAEARRFNRLLIDAGLIKQL